MRKVMRALMRKMFPIFPAEFVEPTCGSGDAGGRHPHATTPTDAQEELQSIRAATIERCVARLIELGAHYHQGHDLVQQLRTLKDKP